MPRYNGTSRVNRPDVLPRALGESENLLQWEGASGLVMAPRHRDDRIGCNCRAVSGPQTRY